MLNGKPLVIELFCGMFGWSCGAIEDGWYAVGFDIEHAPYHGDVPKGADLVLQDVLTLDGRQFKDADLLLCSPPCQEFSYMAMPWKRGKQISAALRGRGEFPDGYTGSLTIVELTALFDACFRIQREAIAAAGRYIPMVVENVRGAVPWVGPAKANYGSFYLWGDVEMVGNRIYGAARWGDGLRVPVTRLHGKNNGGSWFAVANNTKSGHSRNPVNYPGKFNGEDGHKQRGRNFHFPEKYGIPSPSFHGAEHEPSVANAMELAGAHEVGRKSGNSWFGDYQDPKKAREESIKNGGDWFSAGIGCGLQRHFSSRSLARKAASAQIAKIPYPLSAFVARTFRP